MSTEEPFAGSVSGLGFIMSSLQGNLPVALGPELDQLQSLCVSESHQVSSQSVLPLRGGV